MQVARTEKHDAAYIENTASEDSAWHMSTTEGQVILANMPYLNDCCNW